MFNFFKRTKKDPDSNASTNKKSKKVTFKDDAVITSSLINAASQDLSKNKSASENVILSGIIAPAESGLVENASDETVNMEKPPDPRKCSVKPCGHGTTAVAPKIPPPKRRDSNTPPGSPDLLEATKNRFQRVRFNVNDESDSSTDKSSSKKLSCDMPNGILIDTEKKNLINQEAKFQSQLNGLSKQLSTRDGEANKLRFQMDELQRDVFAKSASMDRLQTELQAAIKESECANQRLRYMEDDLQISKQRNTDLSEEITLKTERFNNFQITTNAKIAELQSTVRALRAKIESLEIQLELLEKETNNIEKQRVLIAEQLERETKTFKDELDKANQDKVSVEQIWKNQFEQLRTVNMVKEQEMLNDFEWKLREIEQTCKRRLQDRDKKIEEQLQQAYKDAESKVKQAEQAMHEVECLKSFECEVKQLRGLTIEQQKSLDVVTHQLDDMKTTEESLRNESRSLRSMVDLEKENLQHMQRTHNNELLDRERKLKERLMEEKTAIAVYWEERLLHECRRLKTELEQLYYEERHSAIMSVTSEKEQEMYELKRNYEKKIYDYLTEINTLKQTIKDKDEHYHEQLENIQTNTDRDILELRRIMDKIDMTHHNRFEKLVQEHEVEIEKLSTEHEKQIKELETNWQLQVHTLRRKVELVKEQMEKESQEQMQMLIAQHNSELDSQWENLIHQKSEAIRLLEEEYVTKYKTLEEQFYTQQRSHEGREVELLKTIDALKNEIADKDSTIDDLQNNVETLEGGIQVLNQEMAHHGETVIKTKIDAAYKLRELEEALSKLQETHQQQIDEKQSQFDAIHNQSQITIEHLQRKCQCLTKLFEEIRARYERRESREEDLNTISDLRQVVAEQEKDLACLNEEKRYFQMKLINFEQFLNCEHGDADGAEYNTDNNSTSQFSVPPTIPECDDDFEDAVE